MALSSFTLLYNYHKKHVIFPSFSIQAFFKCKNIMLSLVTRAYQFLGEKVFHILFQNLQKNIWKQGLKKDKLLVR